jgi:hypothetical protein
MPKNTSPASRSSSSSTPPSFIAFVGKVIETVYRCDSAAVVAGAYHCGSLTREALYQGVEVVYRCDGDGFRVAAGDFYSHQCYVGDQQENDQVEFVATKNASTSDGGLVEGRNDTEDGIRKEMTAPRRNSTETVNIHSAISATLTFEDSILNGPNSINELSSTASSLLDSVASDPKSASKVVVSRPQTPTMNGFCFGT